MDTAQLDFSEARPEFVHLSEAEVWDALGRDDDNDIAAEVTRLICRFWARFLECARKHGNVPPHVMHVAVRHPIERVAVVMMIGYIESEFGIPPFITRH